VEPSDDAYDEHRRATCAALNGRFSLIAVGTHGGAVLLTGLPVRDGPPSRPELLALPAGTPGAHATGTVQTMEWSSDGYVLAVGWAHGWAVWSVGGRCLASSFGVEDHQVDQDKFQDAFMYGVRRLVSAAVFSLIRCGNHQLTHLSVLGTWQLRAVCTRGGVTE
jgi:hypothetical protein